VQEFSPAQGALRSRPELGIAVKTIACLLAACLLCSVTVLADEESGHHHDAGEQLGTVSFPTSCAPAAEKSFERGVALLHSFWYEEAQKQFEQVARQDPKCAMAHWGVAMSLWHQLWSRPDAAALELGWEEVRKAETLAPKTAREREYIAALEEFYRDPAKREYQTRTEAYSRAMKTVYAHNPDDLEAGAFYALSLLASEPPNDSSFANRKQAIAILNKLYAKEPNHPGLAHYLIHSCDKPQLAALGLDAARSYARIAPSSPHAVHMPSHIFARLGLWQEDIQSNLASIAVTEKATAMHMGGEGHKVHAMDFLLYAYLQVGQDADARKLVDEARAFHPTGQGDMAMYVDYARVGFPATYYVEMRQWSEASALEPPADVEPINKTAAYWARAIGSAHLHNAKAARKDVQQFDAQVEMVRKSKYSYMADDTRTDRDEMEAWLAFAENQNEEAMRRMRAVADRQDTVGKPEVAIPAREMLADMLLEVNRPSEALAEYERALKTDPNRFNGIYGAARAAELVHQTEKANAYYAQLLKNCDNGAHSERPELARAKTLLARN
jgi:tetratricopeptide (TPR) repeat protein